MFAVMKVITAVLIAKTNRVASCDDALANLRKQREKQTNCRKIKDVFNGLDVDGGGSLSWEEIEPLLNDDLLKTWLTT